MNLNKIIFAGTVAVSLTLSSMASAALGGAPNVDKEYLEKHWNGKQGAQSTSVAGVLLHWTADACGKLNGQVSDVTKCISQNKSASN